MHDNGFIIFYILLTYTYISSYECLYTHILYGFPIYEHIHCTYILVIYTFVIENCLFTTPCLITREFAIKYFMSLYFISLFQILFPLVMISYLIPYTLYVWYFLFFLLLKIKIYAYLWWIELFCLIVKIIGFYPRSQLVHLILCLIFTLFPMLFMTLFHIVK